VSLVPSPRISPQILRPRSLPLHPLSDQHVTILALRFDADTQPRHVSYMCVICVQRATGEFLVYGTVIFDCRVLLHLAVVDYFRRYRRCLFPCYPLINVDAK
jgi:hypothetical protein